jgi:hypothetical protein
MKSNNKPSPVGGRLSRAWSGVAKMAHRLGRSVRRQMLRGAAYSLGSGAVSLIMLWVQSRI